ncbi:MAG: tRNA uridine-5-carboxymethylaminomethyl(34) synthesis GTPase MnmE [Verrucomicrobia bacterium]|nr:tRNA uridine-5-carboxymethylaminomethyl(34) synthesis GTPase MnmE [Verrucomicrobiota bacterium]
MLSPEDTIAAIATPLGEAALGLVRLSGPRCLEVADRCFRPSGQGSLPSHCATHTAHYGHIVRDGRVVDEVMVLILRAPRTFTREDSVEIGCHGGLVVVKAVLEAVLAAGARPAEPGEFTRRAFLSGRIDLTQAEAVADLIHARTEFAASVAQEQLAGKLSKQIEALRAELMEALAVVEAHIDFPEEDLPPQTQAGLWDRVTRARAFVGRLLARAGEGQVLRRGLRAALVGRPNAGKSSLLNHLLGHERAIVSPTPGTTRDTIEETASIRGIPVIFIDTAGMRETADAVEREGVERSRRAMGTADLVLHVVDQSEPPHSDDLSLLADGSGSKSILILNKCDRSCHPDWTRVVDLREAVRISCLEGTGLEDLKEVVSRRVWQGGGPAESWQLMINARHQDALRRAGEALEKAQAAMESNWTLEIAAMELRAAAGAAGEVVGKTSTEDLLDLIFSKFCIGK